MSINDSGERSDTLRIPARWLALVLSLLLHGLLLWQWRIVPLPPTPENAGKGATIGALTARIARASARQAAPAPVPTPPAVPAPPPPKPRPPPPAPKPSDPVPPKPEPARPPVLSVPDAPGQPRPQPELPSASAPDMMAQIESRRRAREAAAGTSAPAQESARAEEESARSDRIIAANLGSLRAAPPGESPRRGGGIFEIRSIGIESAEFLFFGWNRAMVRNTTQSIEVRRGTNPTIQIAIVRRMIAIIRDYENGDFQWQSRRLGRSVTLSARAADNAGLEKFLMTEFF